MRKIRIGLGLLFSTLLLASCIPLDNFDGYTEPKSKLDARVGMHMDKLILKIGAPSGLAVLRNGSTVLTYQRSGTAIKQAPRVRSVSWCRRTSYITDKGGVVRKWRRNKC